MMLPEESEIYLLITRHLAFKTNAAEDDRLYEWIAESKENELVFQQLRAIWLSDKRHVNEPAEAAEAFADLKNRLQEEEFQAGHRHGHYRRWLMIAAASVFLIAGAVLLGKKMGGDKVVYLERTAKADEHASFTLGDGTFVCLAPGSRMVYPEKFTPDNRRIILQGQAFFRVAKNPHCPFVVVSGKFSTEVLGTAFTISAFDNQEKVSIALVEGKIRVTDSTHLFNCLLQPGKEFLYNKNTNETSVRDIDSNENITGWIDKKLVFNNITLGEAAVQIQAVYGTRLIFESQAVADCKIWGRFINEPLNNILETIRLAGDIKCVKGSQNTIFISKIK